MFCISISHKNALSRERKQFALSRGEKEALLQAMQESGQAEGCVILMTCNRSEIYVTGNENIYRELEQFYVQKKGVRAEVFRERFMRYEGKEALRHLFFVACGLDSAVLGEVEIIRQVKEAYLFSKERNATDTELNLSFQGALCLAKEMTTQSQMTRLPVSVGTLTTEAALSFCQKKEEPHILLVGGSGAMGSIVLRDLEDACDRVRIVATSRKHGSGQRKFCDTRQVKWVHYDRRYDYLGWADVVISATTSPHYTFLAQRVQEKLDDMTNLLFVDLAIPRDIDETIDSLSGCRLCNMDDIQQLARENNEKKRAEAKKTEWIVKKRVDETQKALLFQRFVKNHPDEMALLREKNAAGLLYRMKKTLPYETFYQVIKMLEE